MSKILETGIVGFGMSAQVFHAPFINTLPGFNLRGVVQRSGHAAAEKYAGILHYQSIDEVIADEGIDLVIITTPNETHYSFAAMALAAGKHVVLEKPFTITSTEAAQLIELAQLHQRTLSVYHNRRYVADFRTIAKLMAEGWLGDVHEYICHFDRWRPQAKENAWREKPEPGSGILYDLGSHLIDQALCLFGLPQYITADVRIQRPHAQTDDYFDLRLDFGFTKATLKASMLVREMGPRYQVHGTKGSYIKHGDDVQEAALKLGEIPLGENWGKEPPEIMGLLHTEANGNAMRRNIPSEAGNYGDYYRQLYATIVNGHALCEKAEHGYNSTRIIELALQSSQQRCTLPCSGLIAIDYPICKS